MNAFETQFKHRINANPDGEFSNLLDTVYPSLRRAAAMADLLEVAGEELNACDLNPDTLFLYAQSIRLEIKDAMSLIEAFANQDRRKKQAASNSNDGRQNPRQ